MKSIPSLIRVVLVSAILAVTFVSASKPSGVLTPHAVKNTSYVIGIGWANGYNEQIKLVDGKYQRGSPGSQDYMIVWTEKVAFGDLNGDGAEDSFVLIGVNSGGSGTEWEGAVVLNKGGQPVYVTSVGLGQNSNFKSVSITSGLVTAEMFILGPNDPHCCPSIKKNMSYRLSANGLVIVDPSSSPQSVIKKSGTTYVQSLLGRWYLIGEAKGAVPSVDYHQDGTISTSSGGTMKYRVLNEERIEVTDLQGQNTVYHFTVSGSQLILDPISGRFFGRPPLMYKRAIDSPQAKDQVSQPTQSPEVPQLPIASYTDGTLLRAKGTDKVYVIERGKRCHIPDQETFNCKGYRWNAIKEISASELSDVTLGPTIPSINVSAATIDVPYISQMEKGPKDRNPDQGFIGWDNCGPASVAMVLSYFGKGPATQEFMHEVARKCNKDPFVKRMTKWENLRAGLSAYRVTWTAVTTLEGVICALLQKNPVLVLVANKDYVANDRPYPGRATLIAQNHFVVVTGCDDKNIYIHDPLADPTVFPQARNPWAVSKTNFQKAATHASGSNDLSATVASVSR